VQDGETVWFEFEGQLKAHQENVDKVSNKVSTKSGERLYMDISNCKATSIGGAKFWLLIVDQFTDLCLSAFFVKKSDLAEGVASFLSLFSSLDGISIGTVIRCDNAGENLTLQKLMVAKGLPVKFKFTPPGSPQFNGVVVRKFKTLYERVRSLLNSAWLSQELLEGLWAEAAQFATDIENMLVT
jgi:hypothetical protein